MILHVKIHLFHASYRIYTKKWHRNSNSLGWSCTPPIHVSFGVTKVLLRHPLPPLSHLVGLVSGKLERWIYDVHCIGYFQNLKTNMLSVFLAISSYVSHRILYIYGIIMVYIFLLQYIYHTKINHSGSWIHPDMECLGIFLFLSTPSYHAMWMPGDVYGSCPETQRFSRQKRWR